MTRNLAIKTVTIGVDKYSVARDFFKEVAVADQEQLVLKKAAK